MRIDQLNDSHQFLYFNQLNRKIRDRLITLIVDVDFQIDNLTGRISTDWRTSDNFHWIR